LAANIEIVDMYFVTLGNEDFNTYDVDHQWILSIKNTLSQVSKTRLFNNAASSCSKLVQNWWRYSWVLYKISPPSSKYLHLIVQKIIG